MEIWQDDNEIVSVSIESGTYSPGDIVFGTTMSGTGTSTDPINVATEIIEQITTTKATVDEIVETIPNLATKQDIPPIATTVDATTTNAETVGAKLFYDTCGNIEALINAL